MPENTKRNIFIYSLAMPAIWLTVGMGLDQIVPGYRLGAAGLVLILICTMAMVSWLFVRKYHRGFTKIESWALIGYCFAWSLVLESLALWSVIAFPEESGVNLEQEVIAITLTITAVFDFLFVWAAVKYWTPKFVKWHLRKTKSDLAP